jgi:hypothetical protein
MHRTGTATAGARVVLAAEGALTLPGTGATPLVLAPDPSREDLDALVDALAGLPGDAVAIVPERHAEPWRARVRTAASALGGRQVAFHATSLPPLAAAAAGTLAAHLAPQASSAAALAAALPRLEAELVPFALLRSTLRLADPKPKLGHRLRSLFPGAWFAARLQPDPAVAPASAKRPTGDLDLVPADHAVLLAPKAGKRDTSWFAAALGDPPTTDPHPDATSAWRSALLVEGVAWPRDLDVLAARVLDQPTAPCPWCGTPAATVPCPTCGHDRNPGLRRNGAPA